MKEYTVRLACEVAGIWREEGDKITMSDDEARHLTAPFGSTLVPVEPKEAEPAKPRKD